MSPILICPQLKRSCSPEYFDSVNTPEFLDELLSEGGKGKFAFRCLFKITHARILAFVRRHLYSIDECHETMQEIYLAVFTHLHRFKRDSKLTTWMYGIAYHKVYRRYSQRDRNLVSLDADSGRYTDVTSINDCWSRLSQWDSSPDKVLARNRVNSLIEKAGENLTGVAKEVYFMRDIDGLPYEKIAEIVGAKPPAIRLNLHRARKQIVASVIRDLNPSLCPSLISSLPLAGSKYAGTKQISKVRD